MFAEVFNELFGRSGLGMDLNLGVEYSISQFA